MSDPVPPPNVFVLFDPDGRWIFVADTRLDAWNSVIGPAPGDAEIDIRRMEARGFRLVECRLVPVSDSLSSIS